MVFTDDEGAAIPHAERRRGGGRERETLLRLQLPKLLCEQSTCAKKTRAKKTQISALNIFARAENISAYA